MFWPSAIWSQLGECLEMIGWFCTEMVMDQNRIRQQIWPNQTQSTPQVGDNPFSCETWVYYRVYYGFKKVITYNYVRCFNLNAKPLSMRVYHPSGPSCLFVSAKRGRGLFVHLQELLLGKLRAHLLSGSIFSGVFISQRWWIILGDR